MQLSQKLVTLQGGEKQGFEKAVWSMARITNPRQQDNRNISILKNNKI